MKNVTTLTRASRAEFEDSHAHPTRRPWAVALIHLLLAASVFAQLDTTSIPDTTVTPDTTLATDASVVAPPILKPRSDSLRVTPAPVAAPTRQADPKIKLVKHHFVYREQVVMAVCMMIFIVLMINTTQALNPD